LVRRLGPALRAGGSILIAVRESQPMEDVRQFAAKLGDWLRRVAPTARLEEMRSVPASALRAWSYQTFAHLGAAAHQRPAVGLPGLALSAVPLALLTLVLNLFAAAGIGARGSASSLYIEMRIANSE